MRQLAFIGILLASTAAFCSAHDPCSLTPTVTDAKLTISIPGGRTSFHEIPRRDLRQVVAARQLSVCALLLSRGGTKVGNFCPAAGEQ